jgi:hypothetical protein
VKLASVERRMAPSEEPLHDGEILRLGLRFRFGVAYPIHAFHNLSLDRFTRNWFNGIRFADCTSTYEVSFLFESELNELIFDIKNS